MNYLLYNPISGVNMDIKEISKQVSKDFPDLIMYNVREYNPEDFFTKLKTKDNVILAGGDGTLNIFVNNLRKYSVICNTYLIKTGTGNDFLRDINKDGLISLDQYTMNLPVCKVNDKELLFLNNCGYGVDGETCKIADELKAKNKKINYTKIAAKLLLFSFKKKKAHVVVDGVEYDFENVWLASVMNGRYYGGGMMMAPDQNRDSDLLTCVVITCKSKLKTALAFKTIFDGSHIKKHPDKIKVLTGKEIKVSFDTESSLQIDGETINNVLEYECKK